MVNAEPDFVQWLRLHQLAAGQEIAAPSLAEVFAGTGIDLRVTRVTVVDPRAADRGAGGRSRWRRARLRTLVHLLSSHGIDHGVPGVAEYAFDVSARPSALRLRELRVITQDPAVVDLGVPGDGRGAASGASPGGTSTWPAPHPRGGV